MMINLNGLEIELPDGASIDVSEDGKKVKIGLQKQKTVEERIRVIEVPGEERVVERIRVVEVERPCHLQHYPTYPTWPKPYITWGSSGNIGGITSTVTRTS